jgi:hypothetical protein
LRWRYAVVKKGERKKLGEDKNRVCGGENHYSNWITIYCLWFLSGTVAVQLLVIDKFTIAPRQFSSSTLASPRQFSNYGFFFLKKKSSRQINSQVKISKSGYRQFRSASGKNTDALNVTVHLKHAKNLFKSYLMFTTTRSSRARVV